MTDGQALGAEFISTGSSVLQISSGFSQSGDLHIAFNELDRSEQDGVGKVMKYKNGWATLGPGGFCDTTTEGIALAFNGDTPYVAFATPSPSGDGSSILWMKKFSGVSWIPVGINWIDSGSDYRALSTAMSKDGVPYILWKDRSGENRVSRYKDATKTWEYAGNQDIGKGGGDFGRKAIAFNASNQVHVALPQNGSGGSGLPTVRKLVGNQWVQVFQFPETGAYLDLAFHNDNPILSFKKLGLGSSVVALVRLNSTWEVAWEDTITGTEPRLAIGPDGTPFLGMIGGNLYDELAVASVAGGKLTTLGPAPGTTVPYAANFSLSISPLGIPHLSFRNEWLFNALSVKKIGYVPE